MGEEVKYLGPEGLDTLISSIVEAYAKLVDDMLPSLTSNSTILSNSANGVIKGINVAGKSEQNVSPNVVNANVIKSEDTLSVSGSRVTLSSSSAKTYVSASGEVTLKPNTQYTLSFTVVSATTMGRIGLKYNGSSNLGVIVGDKTATSKSYAQTFTTPSDLTSAKIFLYSTFETSAIGNTVFDGIQINEGASALPYTPYTGTPTPTNPIPIIDASGEVTAHTINLCNVDDIVLGKSWNDTANASRGYVEITDVVVGETYTLSTENINGLSSISAMPMSGTELVGSAKTVDANTSSVSFAIANTVDKIRILFVAPSGTLTKAMAEGTRTMFCKGTSKSYVPYQSNTITLPFSPKSVGSVANELIVNEDGSAKIVQRVFEYRLPSSNAWTLMETKTNTLRFVIANVLSAVNTECMCEYFKPTTQVGMGKIDEPSICVRDDLKGIAVMIDKATASTKEQFLAWLNSNEVMLHYCTTPIETPLTPEEVASIRQLQTYKGTTVIDSEMDVVSVSYYKNTDIGSAIGEVSTRAVENSNAIAEVNDRVDGLEQLINNLDILDEEEF